jgi:hypothetical protein
MGLTEKEMEYLSRVLDSCDAALIGKPTLESIYDPAWRSQFRQRTLAVNCMDDVAYPSAYAAHVLEMFYPVDYQKRLEEGARLLLAKLPVSERNHLIERMRGAGCLSAEEELLLARGFALEFGDAGVLPPPGNSSQPRPEFVVRVPGHEIDVEAKGLLDSQEVQQLNDCARRFGTGGWFTFGQVDTPNRLRAGLARKLLSVREGVPRIVVLTQYTPWLTPDVTIPLIRQLALSPQGFSIPDVKHPLAIGYVFQRGIQGVWFNQSVQDRHGINAELCERLRRAVRDSFYPRPDGLFLDETVDAHHENDSIARMVASRAAPATGLARRGRL